MIQQPPNPQGQRASTHRILEGLSPEVELEAAGRRLLLNLHKAPQDCWGLKGDGLLEAEVFRLGRRRQQEVVDGSCGGSGGEGAADRVSILPMTQRRGRAQSQGVTGGALGGGEGRLRVRESRTISVAAGQKGEHADGQAICG